MKPLWYLLRTANLCKCSCTDEVPGLRPPGCSLPLQHGQGGHGEGGGVAPGQDLGAICPSNMDREDREEVVELLLAMEDV